jgi:nucleoside-diphosphate-sugar epimerase
VVFGAGAIGLALVEALRRRGETGIRLVNRSGSASVADDVEVVGGDAADPAFTVSVAAGARVVYQVLNPPYHQWTERFPALQAGVLVGAEVAGARLVSMENVYLYGRPAGRPLTEARSADAHTRKNRLRARMACELLAADAAGRVEVALGRASDYFGRRGGAQSNLGDRVFPADPALPGATRPPRHPRDGTRRGPTTARLEHRDALRRLRPGLGLVGDRHHPDLPVGAVAGPLARREGLQAFLTTARPLRAPDPAPPVAPADFAGSHEGDVHVR